MSRFSRPLQSAIYGENGARALARACLKPNELTDEDSYIIDTMFNTKLTRVARIKAQETAGGYDSGWEIMSANVIDTILGFPQGEAWLKSSKLRDSEFQKLVEKQIENSSPRSCHVGIDALRGRSNESSNVNESM